MIFEELLNSICLLIYFVNFCSQLCKTKKYCKQNTLKTNQKPQFHQKQSYPSICSVLQPDDVSMTNQRQNLCIAYIGYIKLCLNINFSEKQMSLQNQILQVRNPKTFPDVIYNFLEKINAQHHFVIRDGKWQRIGLGTWSKDILQWNINNTLKLWDNSHPLILKQIGNIRFPYLKVLVLENNQITSIEGLERIQLPELEHLDLARNSLTNLKSLRKFKSQNLKQLALSSNYITNFNALSELQGTKLEKLHVQWFFDKVKCHNPRWILKIDSGKLQSLSKFLVIPVLQSSSTIGEEEKVFEKLMKKNVSLKISKKRR